MSQLNPASKPESEEHRLRRDEEGPGEQRSSAGRPDVTTYFAFTAEKPRALAEALRNALAVVEKLGFLPVGFDGHDPEWSWTVQQVATCPAIPRAASEGQQSREAYGTPRTRLDFALEGQWAEVDCDACRAGSLAARAPKEEIEA